MRMCAVKFLLNSVLSYCNYVFQHCKSSTSDLPHANVLVYLIKCLKWNIGGIYNHTIIYISDDKINLLLEPTYFEFCIIS